MIDKLADIGVALTNRVVNPGGLSDQRRLRSEVRGKIVVVTGASFGLGEACARMLGRAGATVLLVARTKERLDELAEEINVRGGTAYAYPADLTDPDAAASLGEAILAEHGRVDILVNNAGKSIRRSLDLQYERFHDFERTIGVNYLGPVRLLLALLPAMRARGKGHIVNVSTIGVRIAPGPRWGAYQASKGAFDTWLRSIAPEIRADGITSTSVSMALIHTRMSAPTPIMRRLPGLSPEQAAELVAKAIVDRPTELAPWWTFPAEVGSVVLRGPIEWGLGMLYRLSDDSESARGAR